MTVDVLADTPPLEHTSENLMGGVCAPMSAACEPLNAEVLHTPAGLVLPAHTVAF